MQKKKSNFLTESNFDNICENSPLKTNCVWGKHKRTRRLWLISSRAFCRDTLPTGGLNPGLLGFASSRRMRMWFSCSTVCVQFWTNFENFQSTTETRSKKSNERDVPEIQMSRRCAQRVRLAWQRCLAG